MSSLDYLDLCRLCLVKDRVSVPIFEGEGDVRQIFLKIAACLPVKVGREDKLPKKICDDCVYKVELFYQFWNTTANAEKQLLQWLGEVSLDEKQGYVTGAHNTSMMKPGQNSGENRLDGSVMQQQVNDQTSGMGMGMMDGMGMTMPIMIPNSGQQSQSQQPMTSVPMDTGGNAVQTVQAVPGPSAQIAQQKINPPTSQEEDEDESEEEDNSDDECDGDDGLPVKEESEDEPGNRTIEPTTFVNVSLACDEAGPSGLQQQKIGEMPEMVMPSTDGDPKSGVRIVKTECSTGEVDSRLSLTTNVAKVEQCSEDGYEIDIYEDPLKILKSEWEPIVESSSHPPRSFRSLIVRLNEASESNDVKKRTQKKNVSPPAYLECSICQMKFRGAKGLKGHRMRMHAAEQPKFECDICGNRYQLKSGIARHMRCNHLSQRGCRYCGKRVIGLHRHERRHRAQLDDTAVIYNCTMCGNKCRNVCNLANHMLKHKRKCTWVCDLCGLVAASSRKLARQPVKKFPCPVCQKPFAMSNFYQHVLLHSSVRPFKCEFCDSTFVQRSTFVRHRKQRHPGPLPPMKTVPIADLAKEFLRSISKTM